MNDGGRIVFTEIQVRQLLLQFFFQSACESHLGQVEVRLHLFEDTLLFFLCEAFVRRGIAGRSCWHTGILQQAGGSRCD